MLTLQQEKTDETGWIARSDAMNTATGRG